MKFPDLLRVRQHFESVREPDLAAAVHRELGRLELRQQIKPGQTVALTAGSRGIANIAQILKETVACLKQLGAKPFIVPTMGSHGGGTAEGQREIIESYGITESFVGAPIRASMEVIEIGSNDFGVPVYLDREASRADHIGVVARVKPHTGFVGAVESGLCKMILIGLGKHVGALAYHRALMRQPWEPFVRSVTRVMVKNSPLRFALAIVENANDETAKIQGAVPEMIEAVDEQMLTLAKAWMPRLPFVSADLVVIDEMGKDISGSGIDTNVVGRKAYNNIRPGDQPTYTRILIRGLSERTHGNAAGIGLAEFTTDRLVAEMDYQATIINCLTANHPEGAFIPVHLPSDREAIEAALKSTGLEDISQGRLMHIKNTLQVADLLISANYDLKEATTRLEVLGPAPYAFDSKGNLARTI